MQTSQPIGVFDSGLGGLSVVQTLRELLPKEDLIYYGDSDHAPYGSKTTEQVVARSEAIVEHLLSLNCKAVVIACNTATSAAAELLRQHYPQLIIIGMEPAIKPALQAFSKGEIIVLATEMTLREAKFNRLIKALHAEARIVKCPAPQLVDYVEQMTDDGAQLSAHLRAILPSPSASQRALVLGCTHFIFLKEPIANFFDQTITIFDGNLGTVQNLGLQLKSRQLLNTQQTAGELIIQNSAGAEKIRASRRLIEVYSNTAKLPSTGDVNGSVIR